MNANTTSALSGTDGALEYSSESLAEIPHFGRVESIGVVRLLSDVVRCVEPGDLWCGQQRDDGDGFAAVRAVA